MDDRVVKEHPLGVATLDRALKSDARFAALAHDEFVELTAGSARARRPGLGRRIEGLADISDVERAIHHQLDSTDAG
jgi:hypothetical protein